VRGAFPIQATTTVGDKRIQAAHLPVHTDEEASMDDSEESDRYGRRELLRKGLMAGGSMALFGLTLAKVGTATAKTNAGQTPASVSLTIAPVWPWGAAVNPVMPAYLSPGATGDGGIAAPLLVVPLLVSVDLGHPPISLPFNVHIIATGDAVQADSVQFDIPFTKKGGKALGKTQLQGWLGVFPVALNAPGSIFLQATLEPLPASSSAPTATLPSASVLASDSTYTLSVDLAQVPLATTIPLVQQQAMVSTIGAQSEALDVGSLFVLISDAAASAADKLEEIQSASEALSIGDMFEMQMLMNNLSQLNQLSTSVVASVNQAISSMGRNVK
jgi:hypothetical protein